MDISREIYAKNQYNSACMTSIIIKPLIPGIKLHEIAKFTIPSTISTDIFRQKIREIKVNSW